MVDTANRESKEYDNQLLMKWGIGVKVKVCIPGDLEDTDTMGIRNLMEVLIWEETRIASSLLNLYCGNLNWYSRL